MILLADHKDANAVKPAIGKSNKEHGWCVWTNQIRALRGFPHRNFSKMDEYKEFFVFTITRNPLDRFVSAYKHSEKERAINPTEPWYQRQDLKIEEYAEKVLELRSLGTSVDLSRFDKFHLSESCSYYINESPRMDMILHFNNIKEEWPELLNRLNIPHAALPHHRRGSEKEISISDKVRELVKEAYKEDITHENPVS